MSIDTDVFARDRVYGESDPFAALTAFRVARTHTVSFVERLTPNQLKREATFEGYGSVTMLALVHCLCRHDQQHLAGLQRLLGKIEAAHVSDNVRQDGVTRAGDAQMHK